jgi:copper resistance protein B
MKRLTLVAALPLFLAVTASAQHGDHSAPTPTPPPATEPSAATSAPGESESAMPPDHTGHEMQDGPESQAPAEPSAVDAAPSGDAMPGMDHGQMDHSQVPSADEAAGNEPAPAPPTDHAADRVFDARVMAAARAQLRQEHGGEKSRMFLMNLGEYQVRNGENGYRWDGEAWYGGDIHRLVVKSEGEGGTESGAEAAEVQALYSRAISPYFDLQSGIRYDFEPHPSRVYATVGFEGLAPYWFETEGALFLSDKGDLLGRLDGSYDLSLTQRWILQARAEINLAAQDIPEIGIGSGVSNLELGLRLRYEIRREFAPYIGVSFDRKFGGTADFARRSGDDTEQTSIVLGIRTWF